MLTATAQASARVKVSWSQLILWVVLTTILALSVHVFMLDVLGIPHPDVARVSPYATFLNNALSVLAALVFYRVAAAHFLRWALVVRCLLLTMIYAMLREALFRNFIMDGVVSHAWRYCFVENLAAPLQDLVIGSILVLVATRLRSNRGIVVAGIAVAAIATFLVNPLISSLGGKLLSSIEYLDTGNIYNPPYGWQVNVPSYLTFVEPVIASFAIAALVWDELSNRSCLRLTQFVLLVMAMKGSILPTLIFSFYQNRRLSAAILSESQFGIEILVMSMLTALGWHLSHKSQQAMGEENSARSRS